MTITEAELASLTYGCELEYEGISQERAAKVVAEVTGISCGIGPYEPKAAGVQPAGNAEQALQALQKQGLEVIIRDSDRSRHENK